MKKPDPYITTLWILGIIVAIIAMDGFYNYNENWNKIRKQGLTPALISGDGINNQIYANHYTLEFYDKYGLQGSYWNPYIFGGMPNVFNGVQKNPLVGLLFVVSGTSLIFLWSWCRIFDLFPIIIALWCMDFMWRGPVTAAERAAYAEEVRVYKKLFCSIAGWLVFYWFYAEIK